MSGDGSASDNFVARTVVAPLCSLVSTTSKEKRKTIK
jgi:hypothetical protein